MFGHVKTGNRSSASSWRSSGVHELGSAEFESCGVWEFRISGVQEMGVQEFGNSRL